MQPISLRIDRKQLNNLNRNTMLPYKTNTWYTIKQIREMNIPITECMTRVLCHKITENKHDYRVFFLGISLDGDDTTEIMFIEPPAKVVKQRKKRGAK